MKLGGGKAGLFICHVHEIGKSLYEEHLSIFISTLNWDKIRNYFRNNFGHTPISVETEKKKTKTETRVRR